MHRRIRKDYTKRFQVEKEKLRLIEVKEPIFATYDNEEWGKLEDDEDPPSNDDFNQSEPLNPELSSSMNVKSNEKGKIHGSTRDRKLKRY